MSHTSLERRDFPNLESAYACGTDQIGKSAYFCGTKGVIIYDAKENVHKLRIN